MTDQDLDQALTEVNDKISAFGPDKKISDQDWLLKMRLVERREILEKIRRARAVPTLPGKLDCWPITISWPNPIT